MLIIGYIFTRIQGLYFLAGQFGTPLFNTTIFIGFLVAVISSVLETIGDYHACAHLSHAPPPPPHAVNRGVFLEGIGSVISGAMGAGHATTSSTASLVLVNISKVISCSCIFCFTFRVFTTVFSSITFCRICNASDLFSVVPI